MKAKKVFENIDFKRGMVPKKALNLGSSQRLLDAVEEELKCNAVNPFVDISSRDLKEIRTNLKLGADPHGLEYLSDEIEFLKNKYKLEESIEFKRGIDPRESLDIGRHHKIEKIYNETKSPFTEGGSYSADSYTDKGWRDIIEWMVIRDFTTEEIDLILRSKLMRWAAYRAAGKNDLNAFLNYGINQYLDFLWEYIPDPNRKNRIKIE